MFYQFPKNLESIQMTNRIDSQDELNRFSIFEGLF